MTSDLAGVIDRTLNVVGGLCGIVVAFRYVGGSGGRGAGCVRECGFPSVVVIVHI